jgi:hypothetical protein
MRAIAAYLNDNGFRTVRGKTFYPATVRHLMVIERNAVANAIAQANGVSNQ